MSKEFDLIKYRQDILDTKSKSFCGAKWYNATTWLGSGTTVLVTTHQHIRFHWKKSK